MRKRLAESLRVGHESPYPGEEIVKEKSIVGDLINFRGLVYSPINENGVVFLFGKVTEDLNMYIEEIKPGFPDCIARRFTGKGWERVAIEFEYKSANFVSHGHNPGECDMIVCWEHDWSDCPLEVVELRDVIQSLPNTPIQRPGAGTLAEAGGAAIEDHLQKVPDAVQKLFHSLNRRIEELSDEIWRKVAVYPFVTYYCPERVFVYVEFQKQGLKLMVFTRGEDVPGVSRFGYEKGGAKWGKLHLRDERQLEEMAPILARSYALIRQAIKDNEPTGWYSVPVEEAEEESEET